MIVVVTPPASEPNFSGVYAIFCKPTGKVYVGSAANICRRWRNHRLHLRKGTHHSQHLQRAWDKYGECEFSFEVLEEATGEALLRVEQRYIDKFMAADRARGFNIAPVAGSTLGIKLLPFSLAHREKISSALKGKQHSAEHKAKSSAVRKGRPSGRKGIPLNLSENSREAMRAAKIGKKLSAEHIAKLVVAHTGKKRSASARANMSAARKGVPATERQMASILSTAQKRKKFSDQQVAEIRRRIAAGTRIVEIAVEFSCNPNTIYRVKNNARRVYL